MKGYNGVAVLSRLPFAPCDGDDPDWCAKRRLPPSSASDLRRRRRGPIELHNFYVPAGGDVPDRER